MSAPQLRFVLTHESLKNVRYFYENNDGAIDVGGEKIRMPKELAIFISNAIYQHFKSSADPYKIDIKESAGITAANLANCAKKYVLLSEGAEFCEIEKNEMETMKNVCEEMRNRKLQMQINTLIGEEWPKIFRWTSECLGDFEFLQNFNEFRFYVCGEAFMCPKILAMLLSKDVCRQNITDSTTSSLELTLPDGFAKKAYLVAFGKVFDLLSGNMLTISFDDVKIYEEIAKDICNEELLSSIEGFDWGPINISNVYGYLNALCIGNHNGRSNEAIEFAAANFYQLKTQNLLSVPVQAIVKVLDCARLRIENEEKLFEFSKMYIQHNGQNSIEILSKVKTEYLDSQAMKEIVGILNVESMSKDVWDAISNRLQYEVDTNEAGGESNRWVMPNKSKIASMRIDNQALKQKVDELEIIVHNLENKNQAMQNEIQKENIIRDFPSRYPNISFAWNIVTGLEWKGYYGPIEIPEGVIKIEKEAFKSTSITSIQLPSTLIEIGEYAFYGCTELSSIVIPSNVTQIEKATFCHCSSLASVVISPNVNQIGDAAFAGCSALKSITIPIGVTQIGDYVFEGCSSLSSITVPHNVTQISNSVFDDCWSLVSIIIPQDVTRIGIRAFRRCSSLSSITIPPNVTEIGNGAFNGCFSLLSITIPQNVTQIDKSSFDGCDSLSSITIPRRCMIDATFSMHTRVIRY